MINVTENDPNTSIHSSKRRFPLKEQTYDECFELQQRTQGSQANAMGAQEESK